jgi:hypothetical protein
MNMRSWSALAILALLCAASKSHAEDAKPIQPRHQSPGAENCKVVRDFVAMVGTVKAEQMAREAGASEGRLAAARRCLQDAK